MCHTFLASICTETLSYRARCGVFEMERASCIMQRLAVPHSPQTVSVPLSQVDYDTAVLTEVVCKLTI